MNRGAGHGRCGGRAVHVCQSLRAAQCRHVQAHVSIHTSYFLRCVQDTVAAGEGYQPLAGDANGDKYAPGQGDQAWDGMSPVQPQDLHGSVSDATAPEPLDGAQGVQALDMPDRLDTGLEEDAQVCTQCTHEIRTCVTRLCLQLLDCRSPALT